MNKENKVSDELVRKMIYLHDKHGLNGAAIGRKFNLSATTVNYHLNKSRAGQYREAYKSYIKNGYSITRKAIFTDEEIDEMIALKNKGMSYTAIAIKFSTSHSTARNYILRKLARDKVKKGGTQSED